jgi:hypothetical protein
VSSLTRTTEMQVPGLTQLCKGSSVSTLRQPVSGNSWPGGVAWPLTRRRASGPILSPYSPIASTGPRAALIASPVVTRWYREESRIFTGDRVRFLKPWEGVIMQLIPGVFI